MMDQRNTRGVLQCLLLWPLLLLLHGDRGECAPGAKPVNVYEGYSSISKSVTVTKRLVFNMNDGQFLDEHGSGDHESAGFADTNVSKSSSSSDHPQVNPSVTYSIETNIASNIDGDPLAPKTIETITNDLNEMQKMVKGNIKLNEDKHAHPNSMAANISFAIVESNFDLDNVAVTLPPFTASHSDINNYSIREMFTVPMITERMDELSNFATIPYVTSQENHQMVVKTERLTTAMPTSGAGTDNSSTLGRPTSQSNKLESDTYKHSHILNSELTSTDLVLKKYDAENDFILRATDIPTATETVTYEAETEFTQTLFVPPAQPVMALAAEDITTSNAAEIKSTSVNASDDREVGEHLTTTINDFPTTEQIFMQFEPEEYFEISDAEMPVLRYDVVNVNDESTEEDRTNIANEAQGQDDIISAEYSESDASNGAPEMHYDGDNDFRFTPEFEEFIFNKTLNNETFKNVGDSLRSNVEDSLRSNASDILKSNVSYVPLEVGESIEMIDGFTHDTSFISNIFPVLTAHENITEQDLKLPLSSKELLPTLDISSMLSGIDLSEIDFSNLDLSAIDLSGIDLSGLDFSKLPSQINLDNFDMSKLPANLDLSSLDLSSLPENFSIAGLDVSKIVSNLNLGEIDLKNIASKINVEEAIPPKFNESADRSKTELTPLESPFHGESLTNVEQVIPGNNYDPNVVDSFLPPNFNFRPSDLHFRNNPIVNFPAFLPSQYSARPPQTPHFGQSNPADYFLINNFGREDYTDPAFIDLRLQPQISDPNIINVNQQTKFSDPSFYKIREQPGIPESSLIGIRHQTRLPSYQGAGINDHVQYVPNIHFEQETLPFNPTEVPQRNAVNLANIPFNLNLPANFNLPDNFKLPASFNLGDIDLSKIPSNFSLEELDISKIASSLNLDNIDFSSINIGDLNIPEIIKEISKTSAPITEDTKSIVRTGFAIRDMDTSTLPIRDMDTSNLPIRDMDTSNLPIRDMDTSNWQDKTNDQKTNLSHFAPLRAEPIPGSHQWVTEDEADRKLVDDLGISHLVKMSRAVSFDGKGNFDFLLCTMCKTGVVIGKKLMNDLNKSDRDIKSLIIYICIKFDLFPEDVCRGMTNIIGDEVLYVLRTTTHSPELVCALMLKNHCDDMSLPEWSLELRPRNSSMMEPLTPPATGDLTILHISDLHLDPDYAEGSDTDCAYPLCCRDLSRKRDVGGVAEYNKTAIDVMAAKMMADADDPNVEAKGELMSPFKFPKFAGRWGAFGRCDLPLESIDVILEAGVALKPDIVYVTGDLPAHDVWMQTRDSVRNSMAIVGDRIRRAFPDTPVVMTIGNHEILPINSFPVPEVYDLGYNPSWLYSALAEQWWDWVPAEQKEVLHRGGYYSVSPRPGLRVLSLNSNYCNTMNWWLLLSHKDPTNHMQWIIDQLAEAEEAGEKVHILSHIPPGNRDCEHNWSRQLAKIVARYPDVVTGVFSGHQHLDQWQVIFDPTDSRRPVGVVYIAPSATTFREHSPSFRVFSVDGKRPNATWTVVDHHTYTANLTIANMPGNVPKFKLRYSARQAFDMADLSPRSWVAVVQRMTNDTAMFHQHMRFKYNYWQEPTEIENCDLACKNRCLCFLVTGDSSNKEPCDRIKANKPIV